MLEGELKNAIELCQVDDVKTYAQTGNVNVPYEDNFTPLQFACQRWLAVYDNDLSKAAEYESIIEHLIRLGANQGRVTVSSAQPSSKLLEMLGRIQRKIT